MSKNKDNIEASRRQALKAITAAGGGIVVAKWSKPVVESVIVPAHAQTSATILSGSGSQSGTGTGTTLP